MVRAHKSVTVKVLSFEMIPLLIFLAILYLILLTFGNLNMLILDLKFFGAVYCSSKLHGFSLKISHD